MPKQMLGALLALEQIAEREVRRSPSSCSMRRWSRSPSVRAAQPPHESVTHSTPLGRVRITVGRGVTLRHRGPDQGVDDTLHELGEPERDLGELAGSWRTAPSAGPQAPPTPRRARLGGAGVDLAGTYMVKLLLMDMEQGADGDLVTLNRLKLRFVNTGEPVERVRADPKGHREVSRTCVNKDETKVAAR